MWEGAEYALKGRGATKYSTSWASETAVMDVHKTLARAWPGRSLEGRRAKRGLRVSDVCLTRSVRGGEAKVRTDHDPASAPGVCGEGWSGGPTGRDAPILRLAWCGEAQKARFICLLAGLPHVCFISRYLSLLDSSLVVSLQPCQRHPRHRQWGWGSSIWPSAAGGARDPPNEVHGREKQTTITEEEEGWLPCAVHGDSLPFPAYIFPTPLFRAPLLRLPGILSSMSRDATDTQFLQPYSSTLPNSQSSNSKGDGPFDPANTPPLILAFIAVGFLIFGLVVVAIHKRCRPPPDSQDSSYQRASTPSRRPSTQKPRLWDVRMTSGQRVPDEERINANDWDAFVVSCALLGVGRRSVG